MKTLNLYPIDYPFETLVSKINSEPPTLILNSEFQKKYKWDQNGWKRASKFIESCLMRIPLPTCYLVELKGTTIRSIILRKENPKNLIQEVFSRLNQGAVELSDIN